MSEIAKCPICGKEPMSFEYTGEIGCCGIKVDLIRRDERDKVWNRYAILLARHNALVEAVAWERECEAVARWRYEVWEMAEVGSGDCEIYTVAQCIHEEARSEVDRILSEEK